MQPAWAETGGAIRSFIALELETFVQEGLAELGRELAAPMGGAGRPTAAASLHLTLRFLGSLEAARLGELALGLGPAVAPVSPFELTIRGVGAFPNLDRPRVVWAGFDALPEPLETLKRALDGVVDRFVAPEERDFHPHLTLVRLRRPQRVPGLRGEAARLSSRPLGRLEAREATLIKSDLRPSGAVYTPLGRYALEGTAA